MFFYFNAQHSVVEAFILFLGMPAAELAGWRSIAKKRKA